MNVVGTVFLNLNNLMENIKMKQIIKIFILIIILTQLFGCKSYYGFNKSDLEKNYKFVEYIMNNIDSLQIIFSDTLKMNVSSSMNNDIIKFLVDNFNEHYIKNRFFDGYDYVDDDIIAVYDNNASKILYYLHKIKVKSRYNNEIIWFEFIKKSSIKWKLLLFYFCNNYNAQKMSPDLPCDKK